MEPTLLILAAGLATRYGSLKQIDRIGPSGERIIDYSVYDAVASGFKKVVYVIRKSFEAEFVEVILDELPKKINAEYVCQELDFIPKGIKLNKERVKPWGTGHALLVAAPVINEPFAVINADDFYGRGSFRIAADFLNNVAAKKLEYALVGYTLKNTLSDNGSVSRAICRLDSSNYVTSMVEQPKIEINNSSILCTDEKDKPAQLTGDEIVSMNLFAFTPDVFELFNNAFIRFMHQYGNDLNAEFQLPTVVNDIINESKAKVRVLKTNENWFGLTYKEDKVIAERNIVSLVERKIYPVKLWL